MTAPDLLRVLLVDDEDDIRTALAQTLDLAGLIVETVPSVKAARKALSKSRFAGREAPVGAIISDIRMPGEDGRALLSHLKEFDEELPLTFLSGHGDVPMAVEAMNTGAYDFLEKPASPARLVECVQRMLQHRRLVLENRALRDRVAALDGDTSSARSNLILGNAPGSDSYAKQLGVIAATDADVLIYGETGVGKEGAARFLHAQSSRKRGPFVTVDCGGLSKENPAPELFGHEIGAFVGARTSRAGRFEEAEGGVLHLDNVEALSPLAQGLLLRVLQEREVTRLGAAKPIRLDIRVIAATKANLIAEAAAGRFREDLFYRLDVANLHVPPLRERLDDVPLLFSHFANRAADGAGRPKPQATADLLVRLCARDWPGNIRELKNFAERYALGLVTEEDRSVGNETQNQTLSDQMEAFEKRAIAEALTTAGGRVADAAVLLGVPRKTLYDKLTRHGLSASKYR